MLRGVIEDFRLGEDYVFAAHCGRPIREGGSEGDPGESLEGERCRGDWVDGGISGLDAVLKKLAA
jgi:hypothetical protein